MLLRFLGALNGSEDVEESPKPDEKMAQMRRHELEGQHQNGNAKGSGFGDNTIRGRGCEYQAVRRGESK